MSVELVQLSRTPAVATTRHKIVFYNPRAVFYTMPLSIVTVASHLDPARFEVVIVDGRLEEDPIAKVLDNLDGALCLGVTVLTGAPIRDAVQITEAAKKRRPDLPIVWGGWHPSMFGTECLEHPAVDVTVQGQGEATFAEIVERFITGETLEGCQGCTFRLDGKPRLNPPRAMQGFHVFRPHDYDLIDVESYFKLKNRRQLDYISSQGCHFRCAFCADPFVYNRRWEGIDPERMGEEIESLWNRYKFDDLNFQDETYFTYANRVEAVADEFIARKLPITWAATMRADQCFRMPEEVFAKCKQSGLRRVLVGVESGSQEMMDRIKKDIKLEHVFFAAERCKKFDVAVHFPFIIGFPDESDESVAASLDVAKRLSEMSPKFDTPIFYFRPYPGTEITQTAVNNGYTLPCNLDDWSDFDYVDSTGPWVSKSKFAQVERFKFYQKLAQRDSARWQRPFRRIAQWRLDRKVYAFPIEKAVAQWIRPPAELS